VVELLDERRPPIGRLDAIESVWVFDVGVDVEEDLGRLLARSGCLPGRLMLELEEEEAGRVGLALDRRPA
jgi:hypothetical protein